MRSMSYDTVAICMATFNGEKYLEEQIESIIKQTYSNWVLFIRDDGSCDGTMMIIDRFCELLPEKIIKVAKDNSQEYGSTKNFATLQQYVTKRYHFNYFMFSDQDDYWLENKIAITMDKMKEMEDESGGAVLVHTDLKVVDEKLNVIGQSFFRYRALRPDFTDLRHLLVQNNATGCTMMWNNNLNALIADSLNIVGVFQHDWWISLVACCFGYIVPINNTTILYRQHKRNVIGASKTNTLRYICSRINHLDRVKQSLTGSVIQSAYFLRFYRNLLDDKQIKILEKYASLYYLRRPHRKIAVIQNGFFKQGIVQILGELLII